MTTKLEELRKLAEAACENGNDYGSAKCGCGHSACRAYHLNMAGSNGGIDAVDALLISAANPQTIIAMCDMLEQMREAAWGAYMKDLHDDTLLTKLATAIAAFDKFNKVER